MWTREMLKTRAKEVLKTTYWKALLVSFIMAILSSGGGGGGGGGGHGIRINNGGGINPFGRYDNFGQFDFFDRFADFIPLFGVILAAIAGIALIAILIAFAFKFFVANPLEVGGQRFFVSSSRYNEGNLNHLGYSFSRTRYLDIVKAMAWRDLFTFLWFLLFIIPGIIKYYSYRMVPYILADNPNIGYNRALQLSMQMTNGQKWHMFVLDLSFIGWFLLGGLACGIGVFFVLPYSNATFAELYLVLRQNAMDRGYCSEQELNVE